MTKGDRAQDIILEERPKNRGSASSGSSALTLKLQRSPGGTTKAQVGPGTAREAPGDVTHASQKVSSLNELRDEGKPVLPQKASAG